MAHCPALWTGLYRRPSSAPGRPGDGRKAEALGFCCACCVHGSGWRSRGQQKWKTGGCSLSGFCKTVEMCMCMGQFLNTEPTRSCVNAGRKATQVPPGGSSKAMLRSSSLSRKTSLCLVIREGVRRASGGGSAWLRFRHTCGSVEMYHVLSLVQPGHLCNLCSSFIVD